MIAAARPRLGGRVVAFVAICVAFVIGGPTSLVDAATTPLVPAAASNTYLRVDQLGYATTALFAFALSS